MQSVTLTAHIVNSCALIIRELIKNSANKPSVENRWITTFRLEARLMIDRWRSLFFWAGVSSGSEAALSKWQTYIKLTYIITIRTARRKTTDYIKALVKSATEHEPETPTSPSHELSYLARQRAAYTVSFWGRAGNEPATSGGQYLVRSFVGMVTFIVAVGSIRKKIEKLVHWSVGTRLQLERGKVKCRQRLIW